MTPEPGTDLLDIYLRYKDAVFTNIKYFVKDEAIANDILQDVFVAFWENRSHLTSEKNIAGWLFVVSHNKSLNYVKKKVRESVSIANFIQQEDSPADAAHEEAEHIKRLALVMSATRHLSHKKKEAFIRCKIEGEPLESVSQNMGISLVSLKDYLKQATRAIRQHVETLYGKEFLLALPVFKSIFFMD
ncbi:MAG: sigma-70 family RNA polymerase sigma factor [Leadbetterella sp.]|nr:sigma-70 family RNA polymerase sigma factor [Leadbetterella sp.]